MNFVKKNCLRALNLSHHMLWSLKNYRQRRNIFLVRNRRNIELIKQDLCYQELYERYRNIIEQGVDESRVPEKSNKTWILWLQGLEDAPPLVKKCIESAKTNMRDREVIVLDEKSIPEYVSLPGYIWDKYRAGIIPFTQFSDLIRICLLCEYGGVWCDATVFFTDTPPDCMLESPLFVFKSIDLMRIGTEPILCSSWYIEAWSNQKILRLTRKLLLKYWKDSDHLRHYFICHFFLAMAARRYQEEWEIIPFFNNASPHVLQFELGEEFTKERWDQILSMSPLHKLNHHVDYPTDNTFFSHILQ